MTFYTLFILIKLCLNLKCLDMNFKSIFLKLYDENSLLKSILLNYGKYS